MRKIGILFVLALSALLGLAQSNARGIVIFRPVDIAAGEGATDAEHIAMATQPQFQAAGWMSITDPSTGDKSFVGGVLVSPDWFVTAQHNTLSPDDGVTGIALNRIKIGFGSNALTDSTSYSVTQIIRVPGYSNSTFTKDLAFLKLSTPVTNVTPVSIYSGSLAVGQPVTTLGHGQPGSQSEGFLPFDGIERAMVNQIRSRDEMLNLFPEATNWVMTQFAAADNLHGNYEFFGGNVAPQDSGGGMFVLDNGVWKLAGLTLFDFASPVYYSDTIYTEMSTYIPFISAQAALSSILPEPIGIGSLLMSSTLALLGRRQKMKDRKGCERRVTFSRDAHSNRATSKSPSPTPSQA